LQTIDCGAAREDILETLGMATYMGLEPAAIYTSHAFVACAKVRAVKSGSA
jgi:hypothetical protein